MEGAIATENGDRDVEPKCHRTKVLRQGLVLLAAFFCQMISLGFAFSLGVFYVEFVVSFPVGRGAVSWATSLCSGLLFGAGLLVGWCIQRAGPRICAMLGGLLASAGVLASSFVGNLTLLYFTFGGLSGFGLCLVQMSSAVSIGYHFEEGTAAAMSIASVGAGIGSLSFPVLLRFLIDHYGWRGAVMVFSGVLLNAVPLGILFVPAKPRTKQEMEYTDVILSVEAQTVTTDNEDVIISPAESQTVTAGDKDVTISPAESQPVTAVDKDVTISPVELETVTAGDKDATISPAESQTVTAGDKDVTISPVESETVTAGDKDATISPAESQTVTAGDKDVTISPVESETVTAVDKDITILPVESLTVTTVDKDVTISSVESQTVTAGDKDVTISPAESQTVTAGDKDVTISPVESETLTAIDKDVIISPAESQTVTAEYKDVTVPAEEKVRGGSWRKTKKYQNQCRQASVLFRNILYIVYLTIAPLIATGYSFPYVALVDLALLRDIDKNRGTWLVTYISISTTINTLLTGLLLKYFHKHSLRFFDISLLVMGTVLFVFPSLMSYASLVCGSVAYGIAMGGLTATYAVIVVDMIGLPLYATGFGFVCTGYGVGYLMGTPVAGWINDLTGSYDISFYIAGSLCLGPAIPFIVTQMVVLHRHSRKLSLKVNTEHELKSYV